MIVVYDPETLRVTMTVSVYPEGYAPSEPYLKNDEVWPHDEVEVISGPALRRRQRMEIVAPSKVRLGDTAYIRGVPAHLSVYINDERHSEPTDGEDIEIHVEVGATLPHSVRRVGVGHAGNQDRSRSAMTEVTFEAVP
jgi:hypothetical protein